MKNHEYIIGSDTLLILILNLDIIWTIYSSYSDLESGYNMDLDIIWTRYTPYTDLNLDIILDLDIIWTRYTPFKN